MCFACDYFNRLFLHVLFLVCFTAMDDIKTWKVCNSRIFLFQITDLLPRTLSGKNVRKLLKVIAQDPSMKGKQEVNATEIRKHCGADFLGVLMQVSDMAHSRTSSF